MSAVESQVQEEEGVESKDVSDKALGAGWGWYILIGIMAQFAKNTSFLNSFPIFIEIILFCAIVYFYFKKRRSIYLEEHTFPTFQVSNASLRAGFYSLLLFILGLMLICFLDGLAGRVG